MTVTLKLFLILLVSTLTYCKPPDPNKFRNKRVRTTTALPSTPFPDEFENVTTEPSILKTIEEPEAKSSYQRPQRGETYQKGSIVVGSRWESEKIGALKKRLRPHLHPTEPPMIENYQAIPQNSQPVWMNEEIPYSPNENHDLSWNEQPVKYKVVETDEYPSVDDIPWTPMVKMPTGQIVEDHIPEETPETPQIAKAPEWGSENIQLFSPAAYKPMIQQSPIIYQSNLPKAEFQTWIKQPVVEPTKYYSKPIVVPEILPKPEAQKWSAGDQKIVNFNQKAPAFEQFVNFNQKWPIVEQKQPNYYYYSKPPRIVREEMPKWGLDNYQNFRQPDWNNYNDGQRPGPPMYQNGNLATSYSNSMVFYEPQQKQPRSSQLAVGSSNIYDVVPHNPPRARPKYKEIIHPTTYQIIRYPATLEDVQAHLSELPAMAPPLDQFLNHQLHPSFSHVKSYKPVQFRPSTHLPDYMMPQFSGGAPHQYHHHKENIKSTRIPTAQEIRFQQQNYAKKYLREHPPKVQLKSKKQHPKAYGSHDQIQQAASSQYPKSQAAQTHANEQENSKEFNNKSDIQKSEQNNNETSDVDEVEEDKDMDDLEQKTKSTDHQNH